MKFTVTYKVKKLPIDYRMKIYSLIKEAVKLGDQDYYNKLFVEQKDKIKPFSFSVFLKGFEIKNDSVELEELTITISGLLEFVLHAFNGFKVLDNYKTDNEVWQRKNINILKEVEIRKSSAYFRTLSPILIENKQGKPLAPNDEDYEKEVNFYAALKAQELFGRDLYEKVRFTPINMKKVVIKESNRSFRKNNKNDYLYFTGYKGLFKLEGHPQDLQFLYQLGLGKRTAYFGLLDYVK